MMHENGISAGERRARIESPAGQRLVAAMRASISRRGIAGSTFDRIASEADVSRGSIAWYFGTKERLLAEVMRADADERLGRLHAHLGRAGSVNELVPACQRLLEEFIDTERSPHVIVQEMGSLAVQNGAIGEVQAELRRRWRRTLGELLRTKAEEGVIELTGDPEGTATLLTALGQGIAVEALADPDWDRTDAVRLAGRVARGLLSTEAPGDSAC